MSMGREVYDRAVRGLVASHLDWTDEVLAGIAMVPLEDIAAARAELDGGRDDDAA